jgi:hypothetical protein
MPAFNKIAAMLACVALPLISACETTQPGIEVRTVEKIVEVQRPCPATPPVRPTPLGALPDTSPAALAMVLAKLAEWSAPGGFGDRAEAYVEACPPGE